MKKFLTLVAAVALTGSLQAQTLADDANVNAYAGFVEPTEFDRIDFIEDNVCYQVISDTEAKVVSPLSLKDGDFSGVDYWFPFGGYYGPVKIPETVTHEGKTYTITELGDYAFYKGGYPKQLPSTLKRIGKFALYHSPLEEIVIPASVEYIGDEAITDASRIILATTNHPRITIGENAFWEGASICVSEKVYDEVCKDPEWNNYKITKYYVIDGLTYEFNEYGYKVVQLIASVAPGPHGMYSGDIAVPEFIWIDDERYEVNRGVINNCDELTSLSFFCSYYFDIANCPNLSSISFKGRKICLTINDCPKLTAIEIPASIPLVKIYNSFTEHLAIDFKHKTERCEITSLPSRSEVYLHTMMPPSGECDVYDCEIHIPVGTLNVYEHSSLGGKGNTFIEDQEAVPVPREVVIQRFSDDKSYDTRLGTGVFTPNYDAQFAMKAESMQAYKGNVISYIEFKTPDIPINVNSEECDVEYVFVTKEGNADEYLAKVPVTVIRGTWQKVWLPEPVVIDGDPLLVGVGRNGSIGMQFCGDGFLIESEKPVDGYYFSVCGTDQGDCPWPINTWMEFERDRKHHFPIRFGITGDNLPESAAVLNVTEPMNEKNYSSKAAKAHPKTVRENTKTYGDSYYFKTILTEYRSDKEDELDDVVKTVPKKAQPADDSTTPIIVTLQNRTCETLDICRIRLTDEGEEVFNEEVPVFLGSNQVGDVQVNAPLGKTTRYHNVKVEVLEVNGKPDEVEDDIALPLTILVETGNPEDKILFSRRMVAEEGTGTWCGWCVRGIVGMEYMRETYPDRFVGIAIHDDAEMGDVENYSELAFRAFPGAYVNRTSLMDPGKDGFLDYINGDAGADVVGKVSIGRVTYSDNQLKVTTTTQFGGDDQGSDYRLAYVITEDGVGPYVQANFYSGSGDDMGGFENKDDYVLVIYNDVARGIYPGITGQPNSVPANITAMEEYQYQYEFKLPGNIDKPRNTSLVVLLYDMFTGQIINADKMALADVLPEVIEETVIHTVKNSVPEQTYNLQGIRVNEPLSHRKGLYIINGKKVVR